MNLVTPKTVRSPNIPTDLEVRAYIYQKLVQMEGVIPAGSSVNVSVEQKKKKHIARIDLYTSYGQISAEGASKDVFEAISESSASMQDQLDAIKIMLAEESGLGEISTHVLH